MAPTEEQRDLKERRTKREKARLRRLLRDMGPERLKAAEKLIDSAAFLAATLQQLQEHINQYGPTCEYQHGANQWGTKRSPEADLYAVYMPQYRATIRLLVELLPGGSIDEGPDSGDPLMEWVRGNRTKAQEILARRAGGRSA